MAAPRDGEVSARACLHAFCVPTNDSDYIARTFGGTPDDDGIVRRCGPCKAGRHLPLLAPTLAIVIIVCYFTSPGVYDNGRAKEFAPFVYGGWPSSGAWYTCLGTFLVHLGPVHLWMNVAFLAIIGSLIEMTEGTTRLALMLWGAQTLGMGLNGAVSTSGRGAVGASAACYGCLWAQVALMLHNWQEMPLRFLRLTACILLIVAEIVMISAGMQQGTAIGAHVFGATTAVTVGLGLAVNVTRRRWEVALNVLGALGYLAHVVAALATGQTAPALLGLITWPILVLWAGHEVRENWRAGQRKALQVQPE